MSIEIRPVGVTCNLRCRYCYEENMREVTPTSRYNREAVLEAASKLTDHFSLFGGEPLLIPLKDVDELLTLACTRFGWSGVQTNGNLITDKHIEVFERCKTQVGISIDGPDELNDIRWAGTEEATRKATARSMWAIRTLAEKAKTNPRMLPSIITTLHAGNCAKDRFPKLLEWFHELDDMGIRHVNIHVMELDHQASQWALGDEEYADRLIDLWRAQSTFKNITFAKFTEVLDLLQGNDQKAVCIWRACDPWNTNAVQGIEHDGSPSHCSRTNKDGRNWLPAEGSGDKNTHTTFIGHPGSRHYERQLALYVTPQDVGGCKDCQYWLICQGNCPGTGESGDWRMRSSYCYLYKRLFAEGERILQERGVKSIADWPNRPDIERRMYEAWSRSESPMFGQLAKTTTCDSRGRGNRHGDHYDGHGDAPHGDHTDTPTPGEHGDAPHGDAPHGDIAHGDIAHGDK